MSSNAKVVLITGGFGVLGRATAQAAMERGLAVAQVGRGAAPGEAGRLQLGGVDLADQGAAEAAVEAVVTALGRLDGVLNVAGAFEWRPVAEAPLDLWLSLYRANVLAAVATTRAALPHLQPGAAIVNVAATAAAGATAGMGPYAAAKAGLLRFTEALADEVAERGVWVGSVSPTILDTPRNRADMPDADRSAWTPPATLAALLVDLVEGRGREASGSDRRIAPVA